MKGYLLVIIITMTTTTVIILIVILMKMIILLPDVHVLSSIVDTDTKLDDCQSR